MPDGFPIVITADRALMAGYRLLFDGMLVASQTTTTPRVLLEALLLPRAPRRHGRAVFAPLGVRRIEAALRRQGFSADEVAVVHPEDLRRAIGRDTRVVAISAGEPLGRGMNSSTMTGVAGGRIYPEAMFRELARQVRHQVDAVGGQAKVVLGGPGAWQFLDDPGAMQQFGIDHVVMGYAEGNVSQVMRGLCAGEPAAAIIRGEGVPSIAIPSICGASTMGVVEISRGCGLGCAFCTLGRMPMQHLPIETILADVSMNISHGQHSVAILSEDFFRYGGRGVGVNPPAVMDLLDRLRCLEGLRLLQLDHANIISIAAYSDEELARVRTLLVGRRHHRFPWVNVGVETASGTLLHANGGAAKMGSCAPDAWGEYSAAQLRRLCHAGFFPMASLVIGLPGESEADVQRTLAWVEAISDERLTIFPVLHAPLDRTAATGRGDLTRLHWQLIKACYRLNFRWIPQMYWDNQTGDGVPWSRRMLLQLLGRGQMLQWQTLFAWHARRAKC